MFGEDIVKPVRDAHYKYASFVRLYMDKLEDILKPYLRNPAARERIARYLEGETVEGLTKQEIQAAERLRKEFFGADPDSGLFKEFGLDPNRFLTDYLPRLRKGEDLSKILPAEVYQEVKFFAEFERTAKVFENREYDVLTLAMAYLRSGAKRKFFKPVQDVIDPLLSDMDPNRKRLFDMWWGVLMGRPIADEIMINTMIERLAGPVYRACSSGRPEVLAPMFRSGVAAGGGGGETNAGCGKVSGSGGAASVLSGVSGASFRPRPSRPASRPNAAAPARNAPGVRRA